MKEKDLITRLRSWEGRGFTTPLDYEAANMIEQQYGRIKTFEATVARDIRIAESQAARIAELEDRLDCDRAILAARTKSMEKYQTERDALNAKAAELERELILLGSIADKIRVAMGKEISRAVARGNALQTQVEALETVPMKYRRMRFNAELQDRVAELEKEKDAWADRYLQECIKRETLKAQLRNAEDCIEYLKSLGAGINHEQD